jgi:hypothetical protein
MIYAPLKSITTQNFGHSLKMLLVLLMAVTSNAPLLPIHMIYIEIGKGFLHKTVSLHHPSICTSHIGWEGAASNTHVFADAKAHGFIVPLGKYYSTDAGFPVCDELLTPYCPGCYHLAEWGRAGVQ